MYNLDQWWFRATVLKVIDGDTIEVEDDLGKNIRAISRLRLKDIDTPELNDKDIGIRDKAIAAKQFLESILPLGTKIVYRSYKKSFDRYVADVYLQDLILTVNNMQQLLDSMTGENSEILTKEQTIQNRIVQEGYSTWIK